MGSLGASLEGNVVDILHSLVDGRYLQYVHYCLGLNNGVGGGGVVSAKCGFGSDIVCTYGSDNTMAEWAKSELASTICLGNCLATTPGEPLEAQPSMVEFPCLGVWAFEWRLITCRESKDLKLATDRPTRQARLAYGHAGTHLACCFKCR